MKALKSKRPNKKATNWPTVSTINFMTFQTALAMSTTVRATIWKAMVTPSMTRLTAYATDFNTPSTSVKVAWTPSRTMEPTLPADVSAHSIALSIPSAMSSARSSTRPSPFSAPTSSVW